MIGPENPCHFFDQSDLKPKLNAAWSLAFPALKAAYLFFYHEFSLTPGVFSLLWLAVVDTQSKSAQNGF